jgi:hypothetical protein
MSYKIYYFGGRRIREEGGVEKGEKTCRYRRRRAGGALAKGRKRERDDVRAFLRKAFLASVGCLL